MQQANKNNMVASLLALPFRPRSFLIHAEREYYVSKALETACEWDMRFAVRFGDASD